MIVQYRFRWKAFLSPTEYELNGFIDYGLIGCFLPASPVFPNMKKQGFQHKSYTYGTMTLGVIPGQSALIDKGKMTATPLTPAHNYIYGMSDIY